MLDGVLQSFIGMVTKAGRAGIPYCMGEFQFFTPPTSSTVHAIIVSPPEWDGGLANGVSRYGDADLYLSKYILLMSITYF